jgi:hypothetical protein
MKRKFLLTFSILFVIVFFGIIFFLTFYHPQQAANQTYTSIPKIRAVRVDYLDESKSRAEVNQLQDQLQAAGVNLVALGAGRVEWTYFPWPGHRDSWSADVKSTGHDYLMEDSTLFGKWAHVSAVVDVLAPLYIQSHPDSAAISWTGTPSTNLVSTMELVDGQYGQNLLDLVNEIATNYPVNSITLTELVYYADGFGDQDKTAYVAYSGKSDWPRQNDGVINIDDSSIGTWRSYEIGQFLDKAAALAHAHGKQLFLEVHIEVGASGQVSTNNGTDLAQLLKHVDKLIVRGGNEAINKDPAATQAIAQYLSGYDQSRIILGIGLWDQDYVFGTPKAQMRAISPADFQYALESAARGGATNIWITPSFLVTPEHWQILDGFWANK